MATQAELRAALEALADEADRSSSDPSFALAAAKEAAGRERHLPRWAVVAAAAVLVLTIGGLVVALTDRNNSDVVIGPAEPPTPQEGEVASDSTRIVISPLVELRTWLVERSDEEVFSVRTAAADRDYWRLMALTDFDGGVWTRSSDFDAATGPVPSDLDPAVPRRVVRQEITTTPGLSTIYLPVAFELSAVVDTGGISLEYEPATGALVVEVESEAEAAAGVTYVVDSAVPDLDPIMFPPDATAGSAADFVDQHTDLPPECRPGETAATHDCWPPAITARAEQITATATTDYDRVRALQDHLINPANFTYDIDVAQGEGTDTIEEFLVVGRGYSQQFASAFATMARSLGIPARVAVGFTPGEYDSTREAFVVRGHHAHAWPEVHFGGVGWVMFDPTPGRGRPHDADVTGLAEQQFPANPND